MSHQQLKRWLCEHCQTHTWSSEGTRSRRCGCGRWCVDATPTPSDTSAVAPAEPQHVETLEVPLPAQKSRTVAPGVV